MEILPRFDQVLPGLAVGPTRGGRQLGMQNGQVLQGHGIVPFQKHCLLIGLPCFDQIAVVLVGDTQIAERLANGWDSLKPRTRRPQCSAAVPACAHRRNALGSAPGR